MKERKEMHQERVVVVVVTYNRKKLLIECLEAISKQTYSVYKIVLIDNASTDGTNELLKKKGFLDDSRMVYKLMKKNTGGAGGFYEGIKYASEIDCDWIWVMDDDTIPANDCLEKLLSANDKVMDAGHKEKHESNRNPSYFASSIYGPEGEYMNLPQISLKPSSNGYAYWYRFLKEGIVSVSYVTFVSVLIKKEAVVQCGLPCKDYFIWGDDSEYTLRLSTFYGDGYFVGDSVAIHKRAGAKALLIENETNPKRIDMFHYLYRNQSINQHYYEHIFHPFREMVKAILEGMRYIKRPLGIQMAKAVIKGHWEAIIQYKKFKNYIDGQLKFENK